MVIENSVNRGHGLDDDGDGDGDDDDDDYYVKFHDCDMLEVADKI